MKTDDTLVRDYLAAVERESAALPPAARQELVADLSEHIHVALAERPGATREILNEVGDPRTIAATALQELGHTPTTPAEKPRRRRSPAWLPLLFLVLADALPYVGENILWTWISLAFMITAIVIVCRSHHWNRNQKWTGLTVTCIAPVVAHLAWYFLVFAPNDGSVSEGLRWTVVALLFVLTVAGCGWLWRTKRP